MMFDFIRCLCLKSVYQKLLFHLRLIEKEIYNMAGTMIELIDLLKTLQETVADLKTDVTTLIGNIQNAENPDEAIAKVKETLESLKSLDVDIESTIASSSTPEPVTGTSTNPEPAEGVGESESSNG
jgi:DNA-binding MltR family transcriptional regulator